MRFPLTALLTSATLCGLLPAHGEAVAATLDKEACDALKVEEAQLVTSGVKDDMQKGPEWAKANLTPERIQQIARLIDVTESLSFRCRKVIPPPVQAKAAAPKAGEGKGPAQAAKTAAANPADASTEPPASGAGTPAVTVKKGAAPGNLKSVKKKPAEMAGTGAPEQGSGTPAATGSAAPKPPPPAVVRIKRPQPSPQRRQPAQARVKTAPAPKPGLFDF